MLPKINRLDLRKNKDFFNTCQKKHSSNFSVYFKEVQGESKAAVIVPKSAAQLATQRSKSKRIYREALLRAIKKLKSPWEIVIIVHKEGIHEIQEEVEKQILKNVTINRI